MNAIEKLLSFQDAAEKARAQGEQDAFISTIRDQASAVKQAGTQDGGSTDITKAVGKLDHEFEEIGRRNPEDAWKAGDKGVVGAQATFLKGLQSKSAEYRRSVPSLNEFVGTMFTSWVNSNHKERDRSALRSPLADSHYQDGYIELKSKLQASPSGWFLSTDAGLFHCPKADTVASELMRTIPQFSVAAAGVNVIMNIEVDDFSRDKLPAFWDRNETAAVKFNEIHQITSSSTKNHWDWVQRNAHTSTYEELAKVTQIKGA